MPNTHRPYAPEFRQQMVELVRWSDSLGAYDPSDIRFQLTGRAAPITILRPPTWSAAVRPRLRNSLHVTRGAREGTTGGGHPA